nr:MULTISPECIES: hypothetical protein [unclassified Enterococcus]
MVNDRTSGEFGRLMKNLIRLDDGTNNQDSRIWVSHAALNKALSVSKTFSTVSSRIDELYTTHAWTKGGKVKELPGDIIFWAIRDVVSESGYYRDNAKETNDFWKKVNQELEDAYQKGTIEKKKELYLMATGDGKTKKDIPIVSEFLKIGYTYVLQYKDFHQGRKSSLGTHKEIVQAEKLLNTPLNVWIDSTDPHTPNVKFSKKENFANLIIRMYQILSIPLIIVAFLGGFFLFMGMFFAKENREYYWSSLVILGGLLLTQFIFLFGVSWFCSFAPNQKAYFLSVYTGAGVPITQLAIVIAVLGLSKLNLKKVLRG